MLLRLGNIREEHNEDLKWKASWSNQFQSRRSLPQQDAPTKLDRRRLARYCQPNLSQLSKRSAITPVSTPLIFLDDAQADISSYRPGMTMHRSKGLTTDGSRLGKSGQITGKTMVRGCPHIRVPNGMPDAH